MMRLGNSGLRFVSTISLLVSAAACRQSAPVDGGGRDVAATSATAGPTGSGDAGAGCLRRVTPPPYPDNPTVPPAQTFGAGYEFSEDWFTRNVAVWERLLASLRERPQLRYLEVGTFEGMSAIWILKHVATAETSLVEGVDPYFDETVHQRMRRNLERSGASHRFKLHRGLSAEVLPRLTPASYDLIYIDGSHTADDVLADAVLCWLLLKPDGLLVFDDWQFDPSLPAELRPTIAIDAFVTAYRRRLELVHRGYQVVVRKRAPTRCGGQPFCTPLGTGSYDFQRRQLEDAQGRPIALADAERELIERLLRSRRFGAASGEFEAADLERLDRAAIEALARKVGLELR